MNTSESVLSRLSQAFTQSVIATNNRLTQDDKEQTFSATYLAANKVQLANGDIRTAQNQCGAFACELRQDNLFSDRRNNLRSLSSLFLV